MSDFMAVKYTNPENKIFSSIIVTGVDRRKILESLSSKMKGEKSLAAFSHTLKIAKKLNSQEK